MQRAPIGVEAQLGEILAEVRSDRSVLVTGEPASGVSTLLSTFVERHLGAGGVVAISLDEIETSRLPAVLVVDDVERLDEALVSEIATRLMARRLVGVFGTSSPRSGAVARLTSTATLSEVQTRTLDADDIAELVFQLVGAYPDRPTALQLEAFSGGRAGVLVPTIDNAIRRGVLTEEAAVVRLREPLAVPRSVASRINARREALDPHADEAVRTVCVARRLATPDALATFDPRALEEAERCGLLAVRTEDGERVIVPAIGAVARVVLDELGHRSAGREGRSWRMRRLLPLRPDRRQLMPPRSGRGPWRISGRGEPDRRQLMPPRSGWWSAARST